MLKRLAVRLGRILMAVAATAMLGWMALDKVKSCVNERAKAAGDDPGFSVLVREGLPRMSVGPGAGA